MDNGNSIDDDVSDFVFQFASLYKHPKAHSIYIHSLYEPKEMMDDFIGVVLQLVIGASVMISLLTALVSRNAFVLAGLLWYPVLSAAFFIWYFKTTFKS